MSSEISDLLFFISYFASQNEGIKFGDYFFDVLCKLTHLLLPPCLQITWQIVLHGREFSPFYKNLKPVNHRPAVFERNPVADILTQPTAPQPHGQILESSLEYML